MESTIIVFPSVTIFPPPLLLLLYEKKRRMMMKGNSVGLDDSLVV